MAEVIFALVSILALFALAMNRASLRSWALAAAIFTLCAQMGLVHGHLHWPAFPLWSLLGWLVAGLLFAASFPDLRRQYIVPPRLSRAQGRDADHLRDRARGASKPARSAGTPSCSPARPIGTSSAASPPSRSPPRSAPFSTGRPTNCASGSTIGASATSCMTCPTISGASSAIMAFSACSSPSSMAAWASPPRRSRSFSARSPRAAPTASPSSWCRTRSAPAS